MNDLNIIDTFVAVFSTYIDSGFGLLQGDVAFLTAILIGIDITLAGLFWALQGEHNVLGQFVKKVLYVGAFAFILNNFSFLANAIFNSFADLGLNATGGTITATDLLKPGFVANTGYTAAYPLLDEIGALLGPIAFFENFVTIAILFLAWLITLFAFFILAIQLFVTIIEFKLTTLAGFVLVPFALWNKTSFLAERVLGNVISSGIKLMVLAVIVGIGSTIFGSITSTFTPGSVTLEEAAAVILGSLALLALGIFGPGIATGLVSGAPQLGAGTAVVTTAGVGAGLVAGAGLGVMGTRAALSTGQNAVRAGASLAGGAGTAYMLGNVASGEPGWRGTAAGVGSVIQSGFSSVGAGIRSFADNAFGHPSEAYTDGVRSAFEATGGKGPGKTVPSGAAHSGEPQWAQSLRREQLIRDAGMTTAHTVSAGDRPGSADSPRLRDDD